MQEGFISPVTELPELRVHMLPVAVAVAVVALSEEYLMIAFLAYLLTGTVPEPVEAEVEKGEKEPWAVSVLKEEEAHLPFISMPMEQMA